MTTWLSQQGMDDGKLPSLTGARWWAALAVFVLHALVFLPVYPFQKSETFRTIHAFVPMQLGAGGVTFFFVLSGFVIFWSYRRRGSVGRYYQRRLLKIFPTHIVTGVVLVLIAGVPLVRPVVWAPNLLLLHTWIPKWSTVGGLNVPSWSLCAELLFYLTFPLALPVVSRIPSVRLWWAMGVLFIVIIGLHTGFYLWADGPKGTDNLFVPRLLPGDVSPEFEIHVSPRWFEQTDIPVSMSYWLSYSFPASRLPEFYVGVLAARLVAEGMWRTTRLTAPLTALAVSYGATWIVPVNYKLSVLMVAPMAAVIATMAVRDLRGLPGICATRPMVRLGEISFAFYMIQFPVMVAVTRTFIGGHRYSLGGWLVWTALSLVVSILAAAAIYYGVDQPLMARLARRPHHLGEAPVAGQPSAKLRARP
ncbi:acyltransferase family protein [Nocardia harenae]|uniref:acyltransferase family protein n=1 Tax=Nocardia harenae TaxID=358707 RepID=UPI000A64C0C8|nr:acyltransferase [Nocardia harenae]